MQYSMYAHHMSGVVVSDENPTPNFHPMILRSGCLRRGTIGSVIRYCICGSLQMEPPQCSPNLAYTILPRNNTVWNLEVRSFKRYKKNLLS